MIKYLSKKTLSKAEFYTVIAVYTLAIMFFGGYTVAKLGFWASYSDGHSMENTIGNNYKLLEVSTKIKKIERGDIVSIKVYIKGEKKSILKRIIGLPGETIKIQGNTVSIDGNILKETYAFYESLSSDDIEYTIKDDEYYVLGDNRLHSTDSRVIGAVPTVNIERNVILFRK